jgi:transportin-1
MTANGTTWYPQDAGVQQICHLLAEYQKPGTNQAEVFAKLQQCNQFPDFNNYLAYIFAQGTSLPAEVRQSAGLLLKNNLKKAYGGVPAEYKHYIKLALLHAMGESSKPLRKTVGTNVAVIVGAGGLTTWPELLTALAAYLEGSELNALEGALDALLQICEDSPAQLKSDVPGAPDGATSLLIPRILNLFKSPFAEARGLAVTVMNLLAAALPEALTGHEQMYLEGLFALAQEGHTDVRKAVCTGLVQMLHLRPQLLAPNMSQLIEYMLAATQDGDEGVALESCEFWTAFCEASVEPDLLRPFLPRLIPVLLKNMVYDEYDDEVQEAEAAEHPQLNDKRNENLKPFNSRTAAHGESDGDVSEGESVRAWNLRKCSAQGLDVLSTVFAEELLPIVTPVVHQRLQEQDWRARESAILALGAISEGCVQGLIPYLPQLVSMLLPKLSDPRPLVRSITCWALSRYGHWIVQRAVDDSQDTVSGQQQLDEVLAGIMRHVLDHNPHVQEAACSALAILEENCGHISQDVLLPKLQPVLDTLAKACALYGRKNLRILYDALSTLAEAAGPVLQDPSLARLVVPPLLAQWDAMEDTDKELLPLMACLTCIAQALGHACDSFAARLFERCLRIVQTQLVAQAAQQQGQAHALEYDAEFITCALDLLSGLTEALGPSVEPLVATSSLCELLVLCCQDTCADVRQSAFALVGDLAKMCAPRLAAVCPQIMALCISNLEASMITQQNMSACNNACWSLGELAIKVNSEQLQPVATAIVERLVPILAASTSLPRSILENSAITLGRVTWKCPAAIAPHLRHFLGPWCAALRTIRDDVEKEHAFHGLFAMLQINPQDGLQCFALVCEAIASWSHIRSESLRSEMQQLLQQWKQLLQALGQWDQAIASLIPPVAEKLQHGYGI